MSKIIDAKKNGYQITYTGEKAERFIRPNGEYQQLSYGDGTTTVSFHKADGTKTVQDSMSFDKNTGKILKKKDANGIESSYSYDDGGKGGDIIFEVDPGLNTLTDFRHVRKYVARDGEQGGKKRCHGANAENLVIKVPEGTVIKDFETGKVIADMSGENKRETILRGGKGGLGNMNFATPTMQAPKYAQPGQQGHELWVQLELKVIADVGLVGFPNVGKSTLLSRVSNAKPKIANYHFTTLNPHLGVVDLDGGAGFVMADIPGLIEGASQGIGLGHDFLRHIERCRVLVHVVDAASAQ